MAGINDIRQLSIEVFKSNYVLLVNTILNALPKSKLLVQSLLPVNSLDYNISCNNEQVERLNYCIWEISNDNHLCYIDLYYDYLDMNNFQLSKQYTIDGIHLQRNAYSKWYKKIASMVK